MPPDGVAPDVETPDGDSAPGDSAPDSGAPDSGAPGDAAPDEPPDGGPVLRPPELLEYAEAEVPDEALPEAAVEVVLVLRVGVDGSVVEAEVATSAGEPFDGAATRAGEELVFSPATRDGEPIEARIQFRYVFERPAPPPPTTGALEGQVLDPSTEAPVAGATVTLTPGATDASGRDAGGAEAAVQDPAGGAGSEASPEARTATADADGRFAFADLAAGPYRIAIEAEGREPYRGEEEVVAGEVLDLTYRVAPTAEDGAGADADDAFGGEAVVDRPPREATRRTVERETLTRVAGTRGDALRVVELLPGVARPPFLTGFLIVRGSAPQDSEVFLNGTSVPLLYHFGGLTSFYNSRLLQRIDFYPGNFSVRYGRRIGGILEVEPRDPATDGPHGVIDINLIDASILFEMPIGEHFAFALAARRSYIDFFFAEVVPDDAFDVIAAPVYYDYQAIATWTPFDETRIRFLVYGSSDEFRTIFNDSDIPRPFNLDLRTQFHRAQIEWRQTVTERVTQEMMFSGGWTGLILQAGPDFGFDGDFVPLTFRDEWKWQVTDDVKLTAGLDIQFTPVTLTFRGGTPTQTEGQPPQQNDRTSEAAFTGAGYRPGAYLESDLRPLDWLQLVVGLRLDFYREIQEWSIDPRMTFRASVTDQWVLKGGLGLFSQPPEFQESGDELGNPNLEPITSIHSSLGAEYRPDETWTYELEGYYKHIFDRVIGTEGGLPPFFVNEGVGRIYGMELGIRAQRTPGFPLTGFLSYTLSRSERQDRDGRWRLFDFDQTHIFTVAAIWFIGNGWELGGTFRLVTGNPFTPVVGSIYDVRTDNYQPVYGETNSVRNPLFHRLDLRVEKQFQIGPGLLAIYLDIQNVYNAMNQEARTYSFDFAESARIPGLPILPSLGIRGEL
ncbi:MAG: TonB-dependent receptor domain-containing protein [Sandaracinaceae bacterium]